MSMLCTKMSCMIYKYKNGKKTVMHGYMFTCCV